MEIYSINFFIFVLISILVYYLLPGKLQNPFLFLASYFFYISWNWHFAATLLALTLFNYFLGRLLYRNPKEKQKVIFRLGVLVNAIALAVFLLGSTISGYLNNIYKEMGSAGFFFHILIPLGFSYRVLECISYLADINLKLAQPASSLLDFGLYMAYFPKLISGPIERARSFLPQLAKEVRIEDRTVARSLVLIFSGLFRSIVLAGILTVLIPRSVFVDPLEYSSTEIVLGLVIYVFYLYNQFAGYTDLMRGISGFFGVELTRNFATPLFLKDFSDFWKRWHISLSQWLRDYVYMPLSRSFLRRNPSRKNIPNLLIPPLVTMLVSGFWHGGSLHLLLWGFINGVFIISENVINLLFPTSPSERTPFWRRILAVTVLIPLVLLAAIPFRLDLPMSKVFLYGIVKLNKWQIPDYRPFFIIGFSLLFDWFQYSSNDEFVFLKWPGWIRTILVAFVTVAVIIVHNLQMMPATFVYP
jgi:D-alanyl-lipoteichoic acid acyltransferase DltB (MBOAT superfamily)